MGKQQHIKHLDRRDGKLLFFGGAYSNMQALHALKKWTDENEYTSENIFCTGDILGYCAQPIECIQLIKKWNINCISGNVELNILNNKDDCGCDFMEGGRCDLFSKNWYNYTRSKIDEDAREWLTLLPEFIQFTLGEDTLMVVHGSWFNTSEFIFKSTPWQKKVDNFKATKSTIIIAGHCGLPFADIKDGYSWLNAGVIGMPANDGTSHVWFLTLEIINNKTTYRFHSLEYDHETTASLMRENNLPASYAETLTTGIWDNCEILPKEETRQQGQSINPSML